MENIKDYRVKIVTGQYQMAPTEQKKMIQKLFGEDAEYNYEIYFHWYNVLHELGHAIMMFNASSRPNPAEEEQLVNDIPCCSLIRWFRVSQLSVCIENCLFLRVTLIFL